MNGADAGGLQVFPEAASTLAHQTDTLFFLLLGLAGLIIVVVWSLIVGFSIRFRRGSPAGRGALPGLLQREVEIGWTAGTAFLAVFIFWWAGSSDLAALTPPRGAIEVHVAAKQWMWKVQHANGAREIDALHVPVGEPVRLVMTSEDVIHSFYVPAFRIKQDVLPGRPTQTWFQATRTGTFHLMCTEYCGTEHSTMGGEVVVMSGPDYARWLTAQPEADTLSSVGKGLFASAGCSACHAGGGPVHAPVLTGLYGTRVALADGRTVMADEAYLHDSILQPRRDVVAGFQPMMPSYAGRLDDGQVQSLVAYIRSLAAPQAAHGSQTGALP